MERDSALAGSKAQKGANHGEGGVGGEEQRSPHLELKPRFPEPQGDVARTSRQEAKAILNSSFVPPGPLAKGGEARVVDGVGVGVLYAELLRAPSPALPAIGPALGVWGGMRRLRPRGRALLCVLPRIYWVC